MSTRTQRRAPAVALTVLLGSAGAIAGATPASADIFPVTTEADLIAAINSANALAGSDTIYIEANIALSGNLPNLTDDVTVTSQGGPFTIDANGSNGLRFVGLVGDEITVGVSRLTVIDAAMGLSTNFVDININEVTVTGSATGLNHNTGDLFIADSEFSSNTGGGVSATLENSDEGIVQDSVFDGNGFSGVSAAVNDTSTLTLDSSSASGNNAQGFFVATPAGGTVSGNDLTADSNGANGFLITAGVTSLQTYDSVSASSNTGLGFDVTTTSAAQVVVGAATVNLNGNGGIVAEAAGSSLVQFVNATADANDGPSVDAVASGISVVVFVGLTATDVTGGARSVILELTNSARAFLVDSLVAGNTGGGLQLLSGPATGGFAVIDNTTFDNNGSIGSPGGGVHIPTSENMEIVIANSTFSNNTGNLGGGLYIGGGASTLVEIAQITVSGNLANSGGGFYFESNGVTPASFIVGNSTVTNNTANISADGAFFDSEDSEIRNSIFSGNPGGDLTVAGLAQLHYNLIQVPAANTIVEANKGVGNVLGSSANLGALANNGGSTLTHLPLAGSLAINAGEPGFAGDPEDQRGAGFPRLVGARIDIGAVEAAAVPAAAAPAALAATGVEIEGAAALASVLTLGGLAAILFAMTRRRRATVV